jgi:hypothetical protein
MTWLTVYRILIIGSMVLLNAWMIRMVPFGPWEDNPLGVMAWMLAMFAGLMSTAWSVIELPDIVRRHR